MIATIKSFICNYLFKNHMCEVVSTDKRNDGTLVIKYRCKRCGKEREDYIF